MCDPLIKYIPPVHVFQHEFLDVNLKKNLMMGLYNLLVLSCIESASVSSFLELSHLETLEAL